MRVVSLIFLLIAANVCRGQVNVLFIKTADGAVNSINLSDIREIIFEGEPTGVKEERIIQSIAESFTLYQNYPNPFNPSTNIQYYIPASGGVEINIYDVQGRLVKALFDSQQQAGTHSLLWNGQNDFGAQVSSGIYFCRVSFNNKQITNKLLMIK